MSISNFSLVFGFIGGLGMFLYGMENVTDGIRKSAGSRMSGFLGMVTGNRFLSVVLGVLVTSVLQSGGATLVMTAGFFSAGVLTLRQAAGIALGAGFGTVITSWNVFMSRLGNEAAVPQPGFYAPLLTGVGALLLVFGKKQGRKAAGEALFGLGLLFLGPELMAASVRPYVQTSALVQALWADGKNPFPGQCIGVCVTALLAFLLVSGKKRGMPGTDADEEECGAADMQRRLDGGTFESPSAAVEAALREVVCMGETACKNLERSVQIVLTGNTEEMNQVRRTEKTIDNMERVLTEYLIRVNNLSLTEKQKKTVGDLFYSIGDLERIGGYAGNLAEKGQYMPEHRMTFSGSAAEDLKSVSTSVIKALRYAVSARQDGDMDAARKVSKYEDVVENLAEEMREAHIGRLTRGECTPSAGVIFLDIVSDLERVCDHAYRLAGYVKDEL